MKIRETATASAQGLRPEMQDVVLLEPLAHGTHLLGVFDGHWTHGAAVAQKSATAVREAAHDNLSRSTTAVQCAEIARDALLALHYSFQRVGNTKAELSGSTATVAVVKDGKLATAQLGDSSAKYYAQDDRRSQALTAVHNFNNPQEIARLQAEGFSRIVDTWWNTAKLTRAVGDCEDTFMSAEAEVTTVKIRRPGLLVVGTDGLWGRRQAETTDLDALIQDSITAGLALDALAHLLVETFALRNNDNAAVALARIG